MSGLKNNGASPRLWRFFRFLVGEPSLLFAPYKIVNKEILKDTEAPFIVLANHVNNWDPVILGALSKRIIHFVASDMLLRKRGLFSKILKKIGLISKTKFKSDLDTVKQIFKIRDQNGIIGIYPEGRRTFNGKTMPVLEATAKLLKTVKCPLVIAVTRNGYLWAPRWGRSRRRGPVTLEFSLGLTREEVKTLSVPELQQKLEELLYNDDYSNQLSDPGIYRSRRPAEYLERILTICPECGKIGQLLSQKDHFTCHSCGYELVLNQKGFFERPQGDIQFAHPGLWEVWQKEEYARLYEALKEGEVLFSDENVTLNKYGENGFDVYKKGSIHLEKGQIRMSSADADDLVMTMDRIEGANIQTGERFEFHFDGELYRMVLSHTRYSIYKWVILIRIQQNTII